MSAIAEMPPKNLELRPKDGDSDLLEIAMGLHRPSGARMKTEHDIVQDPEPFNCQNRQTSKFFVVVGALLAAGLVTLSVWILVR